MNLFSFDSLFSRFLYLVADILTLHFLWLLYSLPVFTIGASTTALYYSCMKRIRTGEGYVSQNFRKSFRENFRQSSIIWLILLTAAILLFTDIRIAMAMNHTIGRILLICCSFFLIPFTLLCIYIFPVQAKFENRIFDNVKNALIMSIRHFPSSLLLLIIYGTFICFAFFFPPLTGLLICCGAGLIGYLTAGVFVSIFRKYIPKEFENDLETSGKQF